ncbi:MAG: lysophospholipid acyltransferase family protein [Paludibacter sp.]
MYYLVYFSFWLITLLPLRLLYILSDILYPIVYYVVGYRKDVVRYNISKSFPEKTQQEKLKIERNYYRYFCDLFIETMKEMHFSIDEIKRRMTFGNFDALKEQYAKGKSVMLMTAHYGNWEWPIALSLYLPDEVPLYGIYKAQSNKSFDTLFFKLRSRFGGIPIEKNRLMRFLIQLKKENKLGNFWMIADQTPYGSDVNFFWTKFLNQDTATLTGTEQLARKFDFPVFYADIIRTKRGYYHCEFIPITLEPTQTKEFEITERYMQLLEKRIQTSPQFWLWSHRRWKYQPKNQA